MEQPTYVRRLREQKYLLIVGVIVALVAGLFAGFTIQDGQLVSRTVKTYMASSTVMLTSPDPTTYQVQIPGVTETVEAGQAPTQEVVISQPSPIDLTGSAILLAYQASSDQIQTDVEAQIGPLALGEAITAVRRTTQPSGDETFPGRLSLPIIDIAGIAESTERAELIAATTTAVFQDYVTQQQVDQGIAEEIRLQLDELNAPVAGEGSGSNPAIPIIVVFVGILLVFIALALIIGAVRDRRRARSAAVEPDGETDEETSLLDDEDFRSDDDELSFDDETFDGTTTSPRRRVRRVSADAPVEAPVPSQTS